MNPWMKFWLDMVSEKVIGVKMVAPMTVDQTRYEKPQPQAFPMEPERAPAVIAKSALPRNSISHRFQKPQVPSWSKSNLKVGKLMLLSHDHAMMLLYVCETSY